jgi:hypothetical protein
MPNISAPSFTFPTKAFSAQQAGVPAGVVGELTISEVLGKYATLVKSQKVFYASASVTAPVAFSTAGQLGPMLWNKPGSGVDAHILAIAVSSPTTAATVAGSIGWASTVQPTAPTTPTAIVAVNAYAGGGPSQMAAINSAGTVIVLPAPIFMPLIAVNTGAVSVSALSQTYLDVNGAFIVGPGNCGYVCGSATLSTGVFPLVGLVWAELPA